MIETKPIDLFDTSYLSFCRLGLFAALLAGIRADNSCPCLTETGIESTGLHKIYGVNGGLQYRLGNSLYDYPQNYGEGCSTHDIPPSGAALEPYCNVDHPPSWCSKSWCFVDCQNCDQALVSPSSFFPEASSLCYSYLTCGSTSTFNDWLTDSSRANSLISDLKDKIENSLLDLKKNIQSIYTDFGSWDDLDFNYCDADCLCGCSSCIPSEWGLNAPVKKIDFTKSAFSSTAVGPATRNSECIADATGSVLTRTATLEYESTSNVGYLYVGLQADGSYIQWPAMDWCPSIFNPFLRDWYSAAVSGTNKAFVLVLDKSGSMRLNDRISIAREAAVQVIRSLTNFDRIKIVLFSNFVTSKDWTLGTDSNKETLISWINTNMDASGGTSFYGPLIHAFDSFDSLSDECNKVILFMTDGEDSGWNEGYYATIQNKISSSGAVLLTYALGSGADHTVPERLACENDGMFYPVTDGDNLALIMGSYYSYFAAAVDNLRPVWTMYTDAITGTELVTGCVAMNDTTSTSVQELIGVVCMDMNVFGDINEIKQHSSWSNFEALITSESKSCALLWNGITNDEKKKALEILRSREKCKGAKRCYPDLYPDIVDPSCNGATASGICDLSTDVKDNGEVDGALIAAIVVPVVIIFLAMVFCFYKFKDLNNRFTKVLVTVDTFQQQHHNVNQSVAPQIVHNHNYYIAGGQ
jgi:hypothetical protein